MVCWRNCLEHFVQTNIMYRLILLQQPGSDTKDNYFFIPKLTVLIIIILFFFSDSLTLYHTITLGSLCQKRIIPPSKRKEVHTC